MRDSNNGNSTFQFAALTALAAALTGCGTRNDMALRTCPSDFGPPPSSLHREQKLIFTAENIGPLRRGFPAAARDSERRQGVSGSFEKMKTTAPVFTAITSMIQAGS